MQRRTLLKSLVTLPAATGLSAQERKTTPAPDETATPVTAPDAAAQPERGFLAEEQFAALHRLSAILVPASNGSPGALEAGVPEFLDFLLSESPASRQSLYRDGLDRLNSGARLRYGKPFAELSPGEADGLLGPLRQPWTYEPPDDPFARFLWAAKEDVIKATARSREWLTVESKRRGHASGMGMYWRCLD